ncbi:MAG: filamentous hemagglutinin N-terminal domain-containing protein [Thermomonas sp.]
MNGSATIGQTGSQMTVTQTTKGAIIDWGSFNIGAGYGVTFDQQFGSSSVTLNRVIGFGYGGSPSSINGTLTSNGNVFIINPAGITFGNNAQVNVGGLVASTLDMSNADFLSGLTSGQYRFVGNGSDAGTVFNSGQLTAADGGTIGLIGSYISNSGTITANLGSVVFGATNDVTLDFFGDGLTQVTVSGNGLARSNCSLNCTGGITSNGNVFAQGGHIEMRTNTMDGATAGNALFVDPANGGRIWISGNVVARTSGTRRGSIIIDAGQGNIDLGGVDGRTGNVSVTAINAGENAGTIELRGNQLFTHLCYGTGPTDLCVNNNRLGLVNASAFGTGGNAGEIHIDVNRFYHGGLLQAVANDGSGGLIDITAGNAEIYNWVFAYGNNGSGGTINIDADDLLLFRGQQAWLGGPGTAYWSASLLAYGTTTGGSVNIDAGNMVVIDLGNVTPESPDLVPVINVTGQLGGNGGNITINAGSASIDDTLFADASGEGAGGSIDITADDLWLGGGLVANGGTGGGIVSTTTTGSLFAAGSAYVHAGTWRIHAPSASIVSAIDAGPGSGAVITDAALGAALDDGTIVQLMADASLSSGASGSIYIGDGVAIVHDSDEDAALELMATGGIYGSTFSIESSGAGALDMDFRANVDGDDPDNGFVSFHDVVLASNGGSINLEGNGSGVYLEFGDVSSAGGDIRITGSGESVGVYLLLTSVSSGDGDIAIDGSASLVQDLAYPFGVALAGSSLTSTGGDISVIGDAAGGTGVQFWSVYDSDSGTNVYSSITTDSGAITLDSTGLRGLGLNGIDLATDSGDITLAGTALDEYATAAVFIGSGGITTNGGDITITGTGGATGVWLYQGDVISNGGDITIAGEGFHYGVQVWENLVSSGAGSIDIDGTATGSDSTGLNVRDAAFVATSGDITLSGSAAQGLGAFFGGISYGPGSSVTTGSGAISVISTGLSGLNVGDVPFTTDTGSITLQGTALGDDFGVYVGAGGLSSNGGDITIIGSSTTYTGVWVNGGDIASNGGDITITGTSTDLAGVQISGSDIDSAGGDIVIRGEGPTSTGLIVASANISSGAGNIDLSGVGGGFGAGVAIGQGSVVSTTSGDLSIDGVSNSYHGVTIRASDVYTASGDIGIAGQGGSGAGFWIDADSSIDGGDGLVTVRAGNDGTSDSVRIDGSIASNTGVNLRPLDGNGTILLGSGTGFALSAAELASIDSPELVIGSAQHAGAILVQDAITRDGNLTLQNQGGSGGIDLQAGIDLGDYTLALATGGDITQSASAAIIAHSLLAIATGDVLLGTAQNDVAATTLAGSSGGDFEFLDATALSIGSVSARGFDAANGQLSGVSRNGINAGGDALVRNLAGNLTLQSGITAHAIDLVTAGALQNAAGATLTAANGWRVWASSWVGETRGGLAGNGALPNLYGCNFNGACAATAPAAGSNYFIYQQQPTAFVVIGSASREYGLANPAFTYSITGGILGDGQGSIASGTPISAATVGSNVGSYAITGSFISPAGYALQFSPGTLSITPATLVFTADEMLRYFGFGNPDFTGTFSGFRNGDTVQSAFNGEVNIYTTAGSGSLGYFPIFASGNSLNYVIQQAPGNEVALQIVPAPQSASALTEFISDPNHSYVYESNIARDWMCPLGAPTEDELLQAAGNDDLGRDWLKVRRRLQLNNCIDSRDAPGCRF